MWTGEMITVKKKWEEFSKSHHLVSGAHCCIVDTLEVFLVFFQGWSNKWFECKHSSSVRVSGIMWERLLEDDKFPLNVTAVFFLVQEARAFRVMELVLEPVLEVY